MEPPGGKAPVPHPRASWGWTLDAGQSFFGAGGGHLMWSSHWELLFLHWEEREWVKLQRTGRKLECIP